MSDTTEYIKLFLKGTDSPIILKNPKVHKNLPNNPNKFDVITGVAVDEFGDDLGLPLIGIVTERIEDTIIMEFNKQCGWLEGKE